MSKDNDELQRIIWCSDLSVTGEIPVADRREVEFNLKGVAHIVLHQTVVRFNGTDYSSFWLFHGQDDAQDAEEGDEEDATASTSFEFFAVDPRVCEVALYLSAMPHGMQARIRVQLGLIGGPSLEWETLKGPVMLGLVEAVPWFEVTDVLP